MSFARPLGPLFVIRHGETDWNAERRLQGQADRGLNDNGRVQAASNGRLLREFLPAVATYDFVASPLVRTRSTMEIIRGELGLDPASYRTDERLKELHFGRWQGFTYAELEEQTPGITARRHEDKWNYQPPGRAAESYARLSVRIADWLADVDRPTVAVTHGGVIRALFHLLGNVPESEAGDVDTPQDRVLRWQDGKLEWLGAGAGSPAVPGTQTE